MDTSKENPGGVVRQYDWSAVSPSVAVLDAIAAYEETTLLQMADELSPPLGREINTDAFDRLVSSNQRLSISFTYSDYHVHLHGDTIHVTRSEATSQ